MHLAVGHLVVSPGQQYFLGARRKTKAAAVVGAAAVGGAAAEIYILKNTAAAPSTAAATLHQPPNIVPLAFGVVRKCYIDLSSYVPACLQVVDAFSKRVY